MKRVAIVAVLAAGLAGCQQTVEFSTAVPLTPNVTVGLSLASGFRGTVEFRCRQGPTITIIGNERSIVLVEGQLSTTLDGGPYRYITAGQTVEFQESYNQMTWTSARGTFSCRG